MRFGIKVREESLERVAECVYPRGYEAITGGKFDAVEIYIGRNFNIDLLEDLSLPSYRTTVHAAHGGEGFDPANREKHAECEEILGNTLEAADILNSEGAVLHPGYDHGAGSLQAMLDFLLEHYDERLVFENCAPRLDENGNEKERYLLSTPYQMGYFLGELRENSHKPKFAFDVMHAKVMSYFNNMDFLETIREFMKLNPKYLHFSWSGSGKDEHRTLKEAPIDSLGKIAKAILSQGPLGQDTCVIFETGSKNKNHDFCSDRTILQNAFASARKVS